ncbi:MAG: Coenzyme F420 hydrogenase/dehydrogenase, beta subunit C-terminal domain [Oscillospiraceae bacterium]|nr:Coenzyme F420 hydrogenase/dehydrogenase, beta subunit C-terminal domain [Oscillospiraceae bacterium]
MDINKDITVAITAASYHGNKGAAAMLQSSIGQLFAKYGATLSINLMSTYPRSDRELLPYDFINVVPAKPEQVLFIAFPLAVFYFLFKWLPPVRWFVKRHPLLAAYLKTDIVLDMAGISFVDSRGFVMNTYAAVTMAIPLLMGVPVAKYSQALGPFSKLHNRMLAKMILPRLSLICARGKQTQQHLTELGVIKNVKPCADGAFSMPDDPAATARMQQLKQEDSFFTKPYIALSLSSVVEGRCAKLGIDYRQCMAQFIAHLNQQGYGALLIANAARAGNENPHNNDLPLCNAIFDGLTEKANVRWYDEEMTPEFIRELIGGAAMLVGSRFHAMIAALERQVPVLLIGWSHKYKEVLDMFGLGAQAVDYKELSLAGLNEMFGQAVACLDQTRQSIAAHLPDVLASSRENMLNVTQVIDALPTRDYSATVGPYLASRIGYAADEQVRANAASGGMVTALLCKLLRDNTIDGAWVTRGFVQDGRLCYDTKIATTEDEIKACSTSIYADIPLLKHLELLDDFSGKIAVVMLPCQMRALNAYLEKHPALREKVALRIALYCSGVHDDLCTTIPLRKKGIDLSRVSRVIYRRGHYRGRTIIELNDGSEQYISYKKTICAYKNAYFFTQKRCMRCADHFGQTADLSFGDVWLKAMKKNPIKHTSCVIRTPVGQQMYQSAVQSGDIIDFHFDRRRLVLSQKRALTFKHCGQWIANGKPKGQKPKLPHRLAYAIGRRNQAISFKHPKFIEKLPVWFVYYYMCFVRVLLSF